MIVRHLDALLERLEREDAPKSGFSSELVRAYRRRMHLIRAATDERDFYALKSLHYEKLQGDRRHQRSMRLNDQFRLILELTAEKAAKAKIVWVISIEDYH